MSSVLATALHVAPKPVQLAAIRGFCGGQEIFCEQLAGWFNDTATWPKDRSFVAFCRWFECQHHSMLIDLCDDPLIVEFD
jgi:hypothetical protein